MCSWTGSSASGKNNQNGACRALNSSLSIIAAGAVCLGMAAYANWAYRDHLNPDSVAYLRLAHYYATGQWHLAVSGDWGPMLSWLAAPLDGRLEQPAWTAHILMVLSALIFWAGATCLFNQIQLPRFAAIAGSWCAAISAGAWSMTLTGGMTPDLLMSGLFFFGMAFLFAPQWTTQKRTAFVAGLLLGAAYWAKAPALPMGIAAACAFAALHIITGNLSSRKALRPLIITLTGILICAGPWIALLSCKYGYPTFSTTAPIAHAFAHPDPAKRVHPTFQMFHTPEPGRITSWEDPTHLPYSHWSPFSSLSNARYQIALMYHNALGALNHLAAMDWLHLGLCGVLLAFFCHTPWRENLRRDRWRWTGLPIMLIIGLYLPVYAEDARYYYVTFPFLTGALFGLIHHLLNSQNVRFAWQAALLTLIATLSFIGPRIAEWRTLFPCHDAGRGQETAAYELAEHVINAQLKGTLAGSGPYATGFYLSFLTGLPWHGYQPGATPDDFAATKVNFVVTTRHSAEANALAQDARFESLDPMLFPSPQEADSCGAKLFRIHL